MKKLAAILIFAYVAYAMFVKPRQDEAEAAAALDRIEDHLAGLRTNADKLQYLDQQLAQASANAALQQAIQGLIDGLEATTATGTANAYTAPNGAQFTYTDAQLSKIDTARSAIRVDFDDAKFTNTHKDTKPTYLAVANNWTDAEVYKLCADWRDLYGTRLPDEARIQDWLVGYGFWTKKKYKNEMQAAGDNFTARVSQVSSRYGL